MDKLGLSEGEVIEAKMVTNSIENAQKKVEENHFGVRKRLLEYDDVMNTQREQVYKKRKNALYGDRVEFDVQNSIYDLAEGLVEIYKGALNFDGFNLDSINYFGFNSSIDKAAFDKDSVEKLSNQLYNEAVGHLNQKFSLLFNKLKPAFNRIFMENGSNKELLLPMRFTDGKHTLTLSTNLYDLIESEGQSLKLDFMKAIVLTIIDQNWKEHLRDMDDLRTAVRNASYEQKDPLVIYKLEGFKSFQEYVDKVNKQTVSFLMKANLLLEGDPRVVQNQEVKPKELLRQ